METGNDPNAGAAPDLLAQLRQAKEEAERANRAKSEFLCELGRDQED